MLRIKNFSYTQVSDELNCLNPGPDCGSCPAGNSGKDGHFFCKFLSPYHTRTHTHVGLWSGYIFTDSFVI